METLEQLRYPIGKFSDPGSFDPRLAASHIQDIERLPGQLEAAVRGLDEDKLNTPYRPEGWTVRQVIHHVPESHMNAYIRFKLGLTEDNPTIKTYQENLWAKLPDIEATPVQVSLDLLRALHIRWVTLLRTMTPEQFGRSIFHPEHQKSITLWYLTAMYSWHGRHHLAHITGAKQRNGW